MARWHLTLAVRPTATGGGLLSDHMWFEITAVAPPAEVGVRFEQRPVAIRQWPVRAWRAFTEAFEQRRPALRGKSGAAYIDAHAAIMLECKEEGNIAAGTLNRSRGGGAFGLCAQEARMRGLVRLLDALGQWSFGQLVASRVLDPTYTRGPLIMHPGAGLASRVQFGCDHGVPLHHTIMELRGAAIRQRMYYTELRVHNTPGNTSGHYHHVPIAPVSS